MTSSVGGWRLQLILKFNQIYWDPELSIKVPFTDLEEVEAVLC